jgi:hypothetical protein
MTMRSASGSGARHAARRVIRRTSRANAAEGSRGASGSKRAKQWAWPTARAIRKLILAFGRWPRALHRAVVAIALPLVLVVIFLMVAELPERIWVTVLWHFGLLFVIALACHGALALDRPAPRHLTEFYLLISVGGVLGGLFNALVAPLVFSSLIEYPLVMVLACALLRAGRAGLGLGPGAWRAAALVPLVAALALVLYSESATLRVD